MPTQGRNHDGIELQLTDSEEQRLFEKIRRPLQAKGALVSHPGGGGAAVRARRRTAPLLPPRLLHEIWLLAVLVCQLVGRVVFGLITPEYYKGLSAHGKVIYPARFVGADTCGEGDLVGNPHGNAESSSQYSRAPASGGVPAWVLAQWPLESDQKPVSETCPGPAPLTPHLRTRKLTPRVPTEDPGEGAVPPMGTPGHTVATLREGRGREVAHLRPRLGQAERPGTETSPRHGAWEPQFGRDVPNPGTRE